MREGDWWEWYIGTEAQVDEVLESMTCWDDLQIFGLRRLAWLLRSADGEWPAVEMLGDKLLLWALELRKAQGWRPAVEPDYYVLLMQTYKAIEGENE